MSLDLAALAGGLLESAPDAIVGVDPDGAIVLVNAQTERLFGYPRAELLGQPLELLVPESARESHPRRRKTYVADPSPRPMGAGAELAGRRRDGTEFPAEISLSAIETGEGTIVTAAVRDVTERKQAELRFRGLLEAAPDAMIGVDEDGRIVLANAQAERMFGYPTDELIGERLELLVPESARDRHPEHRASFVANPPQPRPMGGTLLSALRRDGTEFPAEISLSRIPGPDGVVVLAAVRDVTDRMAIEQELRDKNTELERAGRAKDTFLASMSHELRTPLNAIIGFTGTLLMELPGPLNDDQVRQLHTVEHSGKHLLSIINDILDLARIESGAVELALGPVDCQRVITEVLAALRPLADQKDLPLLVETPEAPVVVRGDSRALGQILVNLLGNAVKFTETGHVTVRLLAADPSHADRATIAVTDTGPGLTDEEASRVFEAFERGRFARSGREGTGLGLYISHKLAELIGANVAVETEPGVGSTFTVVLGDA